MNDLTAHLDGFRPSEKIEAGTRSVVISLVADGKALPAYGFSLQDRRDDPTGEVENERAMVLAQAMCLFLNSGGRKEDLFLLADRMVQRLPHIEPPYKAVSVLPPAGGGMIIWGRPDGTFLKVVEGPEGFSEVMSEAQLKESLADEFKVDPADLEGGDWP